MRNQYRRNKEKIFNLQKFEHGFNYCVKCYSLDNLTIDHIIPMSKGGTHRIENLQVCCEECNMDKGNKLEKQVRPRHEILLGLKRMYESCN